MAGINTSIAVELVPELTPRDAAFVRALLAIAEEIQTLCEVGMEIYPHETIPGVHTLDRAGIEDLDDELLDQAAELVANEKRSRAERS